MKKKLSPSFVPVRQMAKRWLNPWSLGAASFILLLIGFLWFFLTVAPVLAVELRYQYKTALQQLFGVSNLRALIIPNVDWDFQGGSRHREYGIAIPRIFLDEPVVFNVDPSNRQQYQQALKQGIAHASSTAFPDNGGIGYYFAHSSSPEMRRQYNAIFYTLGKLKKGDAVYIWFDGKKYKYEVTETLVTSPDDVGFLHQEYERESIVLQTCWPPGTTLQRFLVIAERVE